ncbi:MAG: zinc ABC transporter substrate-binding protein [Bacteroidota bacterium]
MKVVATTGMIEDAVLNIADTLVELQALMGPGVDPHLYKATQGDLKKLTGADLIFYNGLHLEGKMGEVFEKLNAIKPVIAISSDIEESRFKTDPNFQGAIDPHIWFDVSLWKEAVKKVASTLRAQDPVNQEIYAKNEVRYLKKLDSLHFSVKERIATIPEEQRILITAHDAFGYFGRAYDIEVKGLQGISTLSEFGLKDISDLVKHIVENQIKAVFIETSVSERAINAVVQGCHDRGFDVQIGGSLYSDAMGEKGTPEGTYIGMVNKNMETIVGALK